MRVHQSGDERLDAEIVQCRPHHLAARRSSGLGGEGTGAEGRGKHQSRRQTAGAETTGEREQRWHHGAHDTASAPGWQSAAVALPYNATVAARGDTAAVS